MENLLFKFFIVITMLKKKQPLIKYFSDYYFFDTCLLYLRYKKIQKQLILIREILLRFY